MNLDEALQTFIVESRELLEHMEQALLSLGEHAPAEQRGEAVNAIFRAAHTIKGSSGLFGLDHVVAFTHVAESVLDRVRDGSVPIGDALVTLLLQCADHIGALITTVEGGEHGPNAELEAAAVPLLAQLRTYLAPGGTGGKAPAAILEHTEPGSSEPDSWHLSLRFGRGVLRNGMDPLSFIRYLRRLGEITAIVTLPDALPDAASMDPENCYLGLEVAFRSNADKATIENVFEFILDDSAVRILPPRSRIDEYVDLIRSLPEEAVRLGEILVRCGTVTAHELDAALQTQHIGGPAQKLGDILIQEGRVQPAVVDAALAKQQQVREAKAAERTSIRVDADKLDHLINLVGELITASATAILAARRTRDAQLQEAHSLLSSLVEEMRDSALQLRMVKIGATFSRFQRVVRDVSREIGKDITLAISGEETELDKTVVEKIADPLTHLVRNAMDHGIEPADVRVQRGKPAQGTVRLNAYHDSGSIVIEVSDDGGGLKRDRILAKAVERGLVDPGKTLSDAEIYALIFEPGFSTAEQVTNLSGRGVGMDVVKRNITALRGTVNMKSEPGVGTTVVVRLPLTLAIIDGFQVGVGSSVFVLPLDMVDECVEFAASPGHDYTDLRGQVLPFIRLRELFHLGGPPADRHMEGSDGASWQPAARQNIVVVKFAGQKFGLVVDSLHGEAQTVIKPLSPMFAHVQGISGSSILGNGEVALILDIPALLRRTQAAAAPDATPVVA